MSQAVQSLSVVIPVFNGRLHLSRCLAALAKSNLRVLECIVVDDGSSDGSSEVAAAYGATVISTGGRRGPAAARNLGAAASTGDILVFLDADVSVHSDTLGRIRKRFMSDAALDALIGSYDDTPADPGVVSLYKNLQHHYVHQHGRAEANTFWTGCGAIRRDVFIEAGGFDEGYPRPCIEDIELGYRLRNAGRRIALDTRIQVQHRKHWSFRGLLHTDIFDRALPWTRLILKSGVLPNDLNVAMPERISALALMATLPLTALSPRYPALLSLAAALILLTVLLNRRFYSFLAKRGGWKLAGAGVLLHFLYYIYSSLSFGAGFLIHLVAGEQPSARASFPAVENAKSASAPR